MTHDELKRDAYIIPTSLFLPQAHGFLKTENTLKTVNRTHPSLLLTRFQFVSNSNFKQSCKTSWIKADNKSCWSRIQTTVNLKSLCCVPAAIINNHYLFSYFLRTPVAASIHFTVSLSLAVIWACRDAKTECKRSPFVKMQQINHIISPPTHTHLPMQTA